MKVIWKRIRVTNSKGGLAEFLDKSRSFGCSNNKGSKKKIIPENLGLRKKKKRYRNNTNNGKVFRTG